MKIMHRIETSSVRYVRTCLVSVCAVALAIISVGEGFAAIGWDGGGNSNWWFDPVNWSRDMDEGGPFLPPSQGQPVIATDLQVNNGSGTWDTTGEGVVYDPANDPFFASAANLAYPTGSPLASTAGFERDYGPQTLYRFYISRNTTNTNLVTIKSGDLAIDSTAIVGRSGSTEDPMNPGQYLQNSGRVNQLGGTVRFPLNALDIGQRETSGWGNGVWDYRGGTLEVSEIGGAGLRLSHGGSSGTGGHGRFIMHNPTTGGHVRAFNFVVASNGGPGVEGLDPDGVLTGVGIVEFHFENGGTRPIQVTQNLSINNGLDSDMLGTRSSRLELVLDSAPTLTGGVPQNLGLFDVAFGGTGSILGTGDLDGDFVFDNDRVFSNADASAHYREGDTVSAIFGNTKYNWTISYTGDIAWTDADNSVVGTISGPAFGTDIVLMGHSSEIIAVNDADFDNDNEVDGADFLIWQRGLGNGTNNMTGDADGNGLVNAADLAVWKTQFGGPPAVAVVGAVPEPHAAALVVLAGLALAAVRRRS
jgi:hypothetical protein